MSRNGSWAPRSSLGDRLGPRIAANEPNSSSGWSARHHVPDDNATSSSRYPVRPLHTQPPTGPRGSWPASPATPTAFGDGSTLPPPTGPSHHFPSNPRPNEVQRAVGPTVHPSRMALTAPSGNQRHNRQPQSQQAPPFAPNMLPTGPRVISIPLRSMSTSTSQQQQRNGQQRASGLDNRGDRRTAVAEREEGSR